MVIFMAWILRVLLLAIISRCKCEAISGYHHGNIGDLLKPPPLPLLSSVPFHHGDGRAHRHNLDTIQYQPPPPPAPAPPIHQSAAEFKFPAPFYKQYNFNFVPPPQPFATTPSPSIFEKVSGWLFPSKELSYDASISGTSNIAPLKKDCNPCNLEPWIPVLRYKVGFETIQQNINPTYGPPSPTAYTKLQNVDHYRPPNINIKQHDQRQQSMSTGMPHEVYGPPERFKLPIHSFRSLSSTYGPPNPSHSVPTLQENSISSTYSLSSDSYDIQDSSHRSPSTPIEHLSSSYSGPGIFNAISSSTYKPSTSLYVSSPYGSSQFTTTTYPLISPDYYPEVVNKELPSQSDVEILDKPATQLELPKVTSPKGFKNSYGELITNTYAIDIPFSVSATAAESSKVKTEILPYDSSYLVPPNMSVTLANPAPFTLNRGRNIHTLQPVALPNLSVSPLPPIFNARPFRPVSTHFPKNFINGVNLKQETNNNINVAKSLPVAEFTHSVEYPVSIIQSPIIHIDAIESSNQTKAYRNIPNRFIIDEERDISSQASEDHVSAAKSQQDSSFETTGTAVGNDLYEVLPILHLNPDSQGPTNHKPDFADLRGIKDDVVDKYRTEGNLQNIDSPLLYLKPSAPHKTYKNFVTISTPTNENEYEIYDDITTTISPVQQSTFISAWDESKTYFNDLSSSKVEQEESDHAKLIQIIIPYTSEHKNNMEPSSQDWKSKPEEDFQARKVQSNTENYSLITTENYSIGTTTENPSAMVTEHNNIDQQTTSGVLNDVYDVKEPPFDIIKLQHTIDDWTEQEYSSSKYFRTPQRTRSNEKYAKQIPDEYFTTTMNPVTNYVTATNNYNYEFYDHEVSSSIQHTVTDNQNSSLSKTGKEYNALERTKSDYSSVKNEEPNEIQKLHIYTAASSFRTTTTTSAPWSEIQTSISPLTKEKVYVVTSKPWREKPKAPEYDYDLETFESKKTDTDSSISGLDDLPFKSPRFSHRPSFGFTTSGSQAHYNLEISSPSKDWHRSINDLWSRSDSEYVSLLDGTEQKDNTHVDENTAAQKTTVS